MWNTLNLTFIILLHPLVAYLFSLDLLKIFSKIHPCLLVSVYCCVHFIYYMVGAIHYPVIVYYTSQKIGGDKFGWWLQECVVHSSFSYANYHLILLIVAVLYPLWAKFATNDILVLLEKLVYLLSHEFYSFCHCIDLQFLPNLTWSSPANF